MQRSTCLVATEDKPCKFPCLWNLPPTHLKWFASLVSPYLICAGASYKPTKFTPKYFIVFDVIVNGIISFSGSSNVSVWKHNLFLYVNLYLETLWNLLSSSNRFFFLMASLDVLYISSCHLETILHLPFWFGCHLFLFFAWLLWWNFQYYAE